MRPACPAHRVRNALHYTWLLGLARMIDVTTFWSNHTTMQNTSGADSRHRFVLIALFCCNADFTISACPCCTKEAGGISVVDKLLVSNSILDESLDKHAHAGVVALRTHAPNDVHMYCTVLQMQRVQQRTSGHSAP